MTPPLVVDPTRRRRLAWSIRLLLAATWLVAAVATHLPAPSGSGSDPATREAVRGVWLVAGETARRVGAWVPDLVVELARPFASDKTIHLGISLALAMLWLAARAVATGTSRRASAAVVAALIVYAIVGELLQGMTGRIPDVGDVIANAAGAVLGAFAVHAAVWFLLRYGKTQNPPKTIPISASSSA